MCLCDEEGFEDACRCEDELLRLSWELICDEECSCLPSVEGDDEVPLCGVSLASKVELLLFLEVLRRVDGDSVADLSLPAATLSEDMNGFLLLVSFLSCAPFMGEPLISVGRAVLLLYPAFVFEDVGGGLDVKLVLPPHKKNERLLPLLLPL